MRTERYFTLRLRAIWRPRLSASRLCYTIHTECQYQGIVKVPGLFVLLRLTSIFTVLQLAELLGRDSGEVVTPFVQVMELTRQGIFRYLRMVIVTTAVYRGLNSPLHPKADVIL